MERRVESILRRLRKHGLRVKCLGCRWEGRDRDCQGWAAGGHRVRLREMSCPVCYSRVCSRSWAERHPDRYREKVRLESVFHQ